MALSIPPIGTKGEGWSEWRRMEADRVRREGESAGVVGWTAGQGEKELSRRVLERLDPHFIVRREVTGKCAITGKRMRIDCILRPRETSAWKNKAAALGVEFKDPAQLEHTNARTKWAAQCVDYTNVDWPGFGFIHVFACPPFFHAADPLRNTWDGDSWVHGVAARILGQLCVGELAWSKWYGLHFALNGSHRVWSETHGVESGRFDNLTVNRGRAR